MCACNLGIVGGTGNNWVQWQPLLLSLRLLGNWIKIIVFRIAGPYIIFRQITNLPQLRRISCAALVLSLRCHFGILKTILLSLCRICNTTLAIIKICNPFWFHHSYIYDDNIQQGRVVAHHYPSIYSQAFVFLAIAKWIYDNVFIYGSGKDINPIDNCQSDKVDYFC